MRTLVFILFVITVLATALGFLLTNPRITTKTVLIPAPLITVWTTVTDHASQPEWRTSLESVEEDLDAGRWTETPKQGPSITFQEKERQPMRLYEIEIVSEGGFSGYSTLEFVEEGDETRVTMKEVSNVPNIYRRLLAYAFYNQSEQMDSYLRDLEQAVSTDK
ncbi:SRPBCC family protein [Enterovibrio coralii]|uniref:Polyketide cyclase n=1 Tax=Enterovibrio coralii TaxID=294935 RepID=A0A135I8B0_9GAMM|nr:SRPBCC family protein [Enterovibrio coralii]KXF81691.1 hypothetical protein ATN88_03280 [Enterovibrio coralii]